MVASTKPRRLWCLFEMPLRQDGLHNAGGCWGGAGALWDALYHAVNFCKVDMIMIDYGPRCSKMFEENAETHR